MVSKGLFGTERRFPSCNGEAIRVCAPFFGLLTKLKIKSLRGGGGGWNVFERNCLPLNEYT